MKLLIITFLSTQFFFSIIAYIGGYDFESRSPAVAWTTLLAIIVGISITLLISILGETFSIRKKRR